MRKARPLIAAFLVVLIQITPGPLGLRRAYAAGSVPPSGAAEWVTVSSNGGVGVMIRQGHTTTGAISPPSVDTSAKVSMPIDTGYVYQNTATGKQAFVQSSTGGIMQIDLTSGEAKDFIKGNAANYPKLKSIVDASTADSTPWAENPAIDGSAGAAGLMPPPGTVLSIKYGYSATYCPIAGSEWANPVNYKITGATWNKIEGCIGGGGISTIRIKQFFQGTSAQAFFTVPGSAGYCSSGSGDHFVSYYTTMVQTTSPVTPFSGDKVDPAKVNSGLTSNGFPSNDRLNGELVGAGAGLGRGGTVGGPGQDQSGGVSGLPGGVKPADIPNMPGYGGDAGDGVPDPSDVPVDPSAQDDPNNKDQQPDIPYTPEATGDPYTLDEVDFGKRLSDFVADAKSSSIFSLPGTVFGNIPGSGTSTMTIQGGQIFGTHTFDFADMAGMWVVLRGIVLTGFSFVAVRVVTLKH